MRLHLAELESGGTTYPAMSAEATYSIDAADGRLVINRAGSFQMRLEAADQSEQNGVSGRQQALAVAVRRSLNRALPEQLTWPPRPAPAPAVSTDAKSVTVAGHPPDEQSDSPLEHLRVLGASVVDGWLQLTLDRRQ